MWVLALDTTTKDGSVALVRDGAVVIERAGDPAWSHAERLPADLRAVLVEAGLGPGHLDLIAVATGPGAFTGLRIGLAAAQGLALALDRPAVGVSTLTAIAWAVLHERPSLTAAGAWLDATRGEVYAAMFARPARGHDVPLVPVVEATSLSPADTLTLWNRFAAAGLTVGVAAGPAALEACRGGGAEPVPAPALLAGIVGRLGASLHAQGRSGSPAALAPEYVRRPDVEIARDRRRDTAPA